MKYIKGYDNHIKKEHMQHIRQVFSSLLKKNEGLVHYKCISDFVSQFEELSSEKYKKVLEGIKHLNSLEGKAATILLSKNLEDDISKVGEVVYNASKGIKQNRPISGNLEYNIILKALSEHI